jgi:hypothetical protein
MMGITGSFAELDDAIAQLQSLSQATERVAVRATPELSQVAHAQWAAGKGPDGTAWPLAKDGKVPLTDATSKITLAPSGRAIVATAPDVLKYHQDGGSRLPRRPIFPDEGAPLPPAWQAPLEKALQEEIEGRK